MIITCPICKSNNIKYFENINTTYLYDIDKEGYKKGRGKKLNNFSVVDGWGYTCVDCGHDFRLEGEK